MFLENEKHNQKLHFFQHLRVNKCFSLHRHLIWRPLCDPFAAPPPDLSRCESAGALVFCLWDDVATLAFPRHAAALTVTDSVVR